MSTPDRPVAPEGNSPPPQSGGSAGHDQWIMQALNGLRADLGEMRAVAEARHSEVKSQMSVHSGEAKASLAGLGERIGAVEGKISKAIWVGGTAIATVGTVLGICWWAWTFVSPYVEWKIVAPSNGSSVQPAEKIPQEND